MRNRTKKRRWTRMLAAAAAAMLLFGTVTANAAIQPSFELRSTAVYLENLDTGTVIFEKNADEKRYPASLTKIMTAIVTLENVQDLDGETAAYKMYIQDDLYGKNASLGGLIAWEEVSIRGLLYSCLLRSACESAMVLADYVGGGSIPYFVEMMNNKAQELGMTGTHFSNPHGLYDEDNYTTARDMATLCKYAMQNPTFAEIVGTVSKDIGPTSKRQTLVQDNTNSMLNPASQYYYSPVKGIKTGTLEEAGRCMASIAEQDGYTYLCVVMGAPLYEISGKETDMLNFRETKKLYEWAFSSYAMLTVAEAGEAVDEVAVRYSMDTDHVRAVTGESCQKLLPRETDLASIRTVVELPDSVDAPVAAGTQIGTEHLYLADEEIAAVPLVAEKDVEASKLLLFFAWVARIFSSTAAKIIGAVVLIAVIAYIVLVVRANRQRRRRFRRRNY